MIDKNIARALKDNLLRHPELSDWHDLTSYQLACQVVHDSGLGTALVPLTRAGMTRRNPACQWLLYLAIVDPGDCLQVETDQAQPPTPVYVLTEIRPITDYVGQLTTCDLSHPWWAVPTFFSDVSRLLTPYVADLKGGRSHWGRQQREAFASAFDRRWNDEGFTKELEPSVLIRPSRARFGRTPIATSPTASAEPVPQDSIAA